MNTKQEYINFDIHTKINIKRIAQRVNSDTKNILKYVFNVEYRFNILKEILKTIKSNR